MPFPMIRQSDEAELIEWLFFKPMWHPSDTGQSCIPILTSFSNSNRNGAA